MSKISEGPSASFDRQSQPIVPALPSFIEQYPNIKLEVTLTDEREDLVAQGVDVAVWLGSPWIQLDRASP